MKVSALELRRSMKEVLRALNNNEKVAIFYRGKQKGVIYPAAGKKRRRRPVAEHPAFGIWKDHKDWRNVAEAIRKMRQGRVNAF